MLYLGKLVETGPTAERLRSTPQHDYTQLLLASVPVISAEEEAMRPKLPLINGEVATAAQVLAGLAENATATLTIEGIQA